MKLVDTFDLGSNANCLNVQVVYIEFWIIFQSVRILICQIKGCKFKSCLSSLTWLMFLIEILLSFLALILPVLISIAYLTLAERKVMGSMQQRFGPNTVGFFGLLQPLADGLKLLLKEAVIPTNSNTFSFIFAPILTFFISLLN